MNTLNLNPNPAAADRGSMRKLEHRFPDDVRVTARRLQAVASDIARQLYRGCFGPTAGFEGIESEACHG